MSWNVFCCASELLLLFCTVRVAFLGQAARLLCIWKRNRTPSDQSLPQTLVHLPPIQGSECVDSLNAEIPTGKSNQ